MKKYRILILLGTLVIISLSCNKPVHNEAVNPNEIIGSWKLIAVGINPPESINIKSHIINFSLDGTWDSVTEMTGTWEGTKMKSSGKWALDTNIISYTAGDSSEKSTMSLTEQGLTLNPDFIIALDGGKIPIDTHYSK